MIISTKEKIKKVSFSFFAQRGYEGTSMKDIADAVGINKASLYSHYSGKEDLFKAVYEDFARDYEKVNEQLFEAVKDLGIEEKLRYFFKEYIQYYYNNQEILNFWFQGLLFAPPEVGYKLLSNLFSREKLYTKRLEEIFLEGMQQGIIRLSNPEKMVQFYRSMIEGLLSRMLLKQIKEEWIKEFWENFWFGIAEKKNE